MAQELALHAPSPRLHRRCLGKGAQDLLIWQLHQEQQLPFDLSKVNVAQQEQLLKISLCRGTGHTNPLPESEPKKNNWPSHRRA